MKKSKATGASLATASFSKPMKRTDVTEMVVESRLKKGLSWAKIAKAVGASKEWTTAALLGQMQMTTATAVGAMLFAANFAVLKTSVGYFHPTTETNALLHTWSLSVEEQFYFIFPLLLLVAFAAAALIAHLNDLL